MAAATTSDITPAAADAQKAGCSIQEKFGDAVDWQDFKTKMMIQVMNCSVGKAPLDYYLAELAVTTWMEHFDKSPDEIEAIIRSTIVPDRTESVEGLISVLDTKDTEDTAESAPPPPTPEKSYKQALLENLPAEDELPGSVSCSSTEA